MSPKVRNFTLVTHVVRRGDGQGRVNYEVVREALNQGWNPTLVASEISPELKTDPRVRWFPVHARGIPSYLLRELVFAFRSARVLRRHRDGILVSNGCITRVPADLNACHFVHASWLASPVHPGRISKGPAATYHRMYSAINARLEHAAYSQARRIVSVSEQVRRELIATGIEASRISTIPNGVDTSEFTPDGPADRARFGLPVDVPMALFAGDLRSPRKNLDSVLNALAAVPDLHLAVAGWLEGSPYPAMARALRIEDRVHFLGNVREMPLLMRSCDVFAFPSRYEACSLVMLEAMASGLPVITARTTGGAELVPPEGGFLMDGPDDLPGLEAILRRVAEDRTGLDRMSGKSRDAALALRWDAMGRRYLDLMETLG